MGLGSGGTAPILILSRHEGRAPPSGEFRATGCLSLARILENTEAPGPLTRALQDGSAPHLRQAFQSLNPLQQREIRERFGEGTAEEILSLATERDERTFFSALLNLGERLEESGHLAEAVAVFSELVAAGNSPELPLILRGGEDRNIHLHTSEDGEVESPPLRIRGGREGLFSLSAATRAHTRLNAILGRGEVLPRVQFHLRNLATQATDLPSIFAMGVVGPVFQGTRVWALGNLATSPVGRFLGGWGRAAVASCIAFGAEGTAFTAASRLGNSVLGRRLDWSARGVWQEFAGGAITLLGLRAMGGVAGSGVRVLGRGDGAMGRLGGFLLPQLGLFSGILISQRVEEALALRESPPDDATRVTDAIATLIHFNVGGRLAHETVGRYLEPVLGQISPHPYPSPPRGEGHTINLISPSILFGEGEATNIASPSPLGGEGGRPRRTGEGLFSWPRFWRQTRAVFKQAALMPFWMMMGAVGDPFRGQLDLFSSEGRIPRQPLSEFLLRLEQHGIEGGDLTILDRLNAHRSLTKSELRNFTQGDFRREELHPRLESLLSTGLVQETVLGSQSGPEIRNYSLTELGRRIHSLFGSIESRFRLDPLKVQVLDQLSRHRFRGLEGIREELLRIPMDAQALSSLEARLAEMERVGLVERTISGRRVSREGRLQATFRIAELGRKVYASWEGRSRAIRRILAELSAAPDDRVSQRLKEGPLTPRRGREKGSDEEFRSPEYLLWRLNRIADAEEWVPWTDIEAFRAQVFPLLVPEGNPSAAAQRLSQTMVMDFWILAERGPAVPQGEYEAAFRRLLEVAPRMIAVSRFGLPARGKAVRFQQALEEIYRPAPTLEPRMSDTDLWYDCSDGGESLPPRRLHYDREAEASLARIEAWMSRPERFGDSGENIMAGRPEEDIGRIWLEQARQWGEGIPNTWVTGHPASRLLEGFEGRSRPLAEGTLQAALALLRSDGVGEEAERIVEVRLPHENVIFGPRGAEFDPMLLAELGNIFEKIQTNLERTAGESSLKTVRLVRQGRGEMTLRFMTPALMERLMRVVHGERAPRYFPVSGTISRDTTVRLKGAGLVPLGLARQPLRLGDAHVLVPPSAFGAHDQFHWTEMTRMMPILWRWAARHYELLHSDEELRNSPFGEEHLNLLADMDPGADFDGQGENFQLFTLRDVGHAIHRARQEVNPRRVMRELREIQTFLQGYRDLLELHPPGPSSLIYWQHQFIRQLDFLLEAAREETRHHLRFLLKLPEWPL